MRKLRLSGLALGAVVLLSLGSTACGETGKGARSTSRASPNTAAAGSASVSTASAVTLPQIEFKSDPDLDSDSYGNEPDSENKLFGHPASAADVRAVTRLVKRYYAAAAAGDGAAACRLIYSVFAEAIREDYGRPPGPPSLRGKTCAAVMSKLLEQLHKRLNLDSATLRVGAVRVELNSGSVRLGFGGAKPDRYVLVHRERGAWKMDLLFDIGRPVGVE
jgi:hypothetical protein